MADLLTPGPHPRESEFRVPGQFGTCGQNALAMAAWNATGRETHTEGVYALMRAHGLCDLSGASTPDQLRQAAALLGLTIVDFVGYGGDDWPGWRAFLDRHAGSAAIVLELSNGQALVDEVGGKGENAVNLHYHYIAGYGPSGDGWAFADGDNWAVGDVLQRYSYATLANARPCAAIAIAITGGTMSGVPTNWHDVNGILTAPNGKTVQHGFRQHILDAPAWHPALMPLGGEYGTAAGPRQDFALSLTWTGAAASEGAGPDFPAQIAALQAEITALKKLPPVTPLTAYQQACIAFAESAFATTSAQAAANALRSK